MFWRGEMTLSFLQCFHMQPLMLTVGEIPYGCYGWFSAPEFSTRLQTELGLVPFVPHLVDDLRASGPSLLLQPCLVQSGPESL